MTGRKFIVSIRTFSMAIVVMMALSIGKGAMALTSNQVAEGLFGDAAIATGLSIPDDPTIVRTRSVNINFDVLGVADGPPEDESEVASALILNLFENVLFTAVLDRTESSSSGSFSWIGHLEGVEYSQAILVVKDRVMVGNVTMPDALYQVRYATNGIHMIYEIDQAAFPSEAEPLPVDTSLLDSLDATDTPMADDGSIIDVMVAYTPAARAAAGGTTAMQILIDLAIAETNQSYLNSGITQRLNLARTEEVSYAESGDIGTDLSRLRNPSDGYMDNLHTLRDTYLADVVSLIVENGGGYCGIAYMMGTVSPSFESWAFSVVARTCATGYYTFGHELGHNVGARHDWYVDDTVGSPYTYNHGYINFPDRWRTIMAYDSDCSDRGFNCTRIQYWSNPNVTYGGDPTGVPEGTSTTCTAGTHDPHCDADNRKTLDNTAYTVANFRSSSGVNVGPVVYDSHLVDDDNTGQSSGNGNGIVGCGETIELYVDLYNQGTDTASDVFATISTTDPYITWLYNTSSDYPAIPGGGTDTNLNDFDFEVNPGTPDGHVIHFDLDIIASNGGPWSDSFDIPVVCTQCNDPHEPNDIPGQATAISYGTTLADPDICPDGDVDYYAFTGSVGDNIVADIDAWSIGSSLDSVLHLYDTDGVTELTYNDDYDGLDSHIEYTLPANGTYYLKVRDFGTPNGGPNYFYTVSLSGGAPTCDAILAAFDEWLGGTTVRGANNPPPAFMPPHPDLLERARRGEITLPDFVTNPKLRQQIGIDQPQGLPTGPTGTWNALALLVEFTDNPSQVGASYFDTLLFGGGTSTLNDYYNDVSYGTLNIVTVNMPSSIGWCLMPQTYAYYVNANHGFGAYPQNAQRMAENAVLLADPLVDYSQYDNDGDGWVDTVFVIHAGPGAEFTGSVNDIWSHSWATLNDPVVDGVTVNSYTTEPEFWSSPGDMTMGVYAHELGHVFGLPDLYDYDGSSYGVGDWSLMAGGSWNGPWPGGSSPSFPDAWAQAELGYVTPTIVTADIVGVSIPAVETSQTAYRLWMDGSIGPEYFLVENRQQTGYDTHLPGAGLLIWHVDENASNNDEECYQPNNWLCGSNHPIVALEQGDGLWELEHKTDQGDAGDPYPGSTNNRSFTFASVPNSSSYYGSSDTHVGVTSISNAGNTMTADLFVESGAVEYEVFLPLVMKNYGAAAGWVTIVSEDFEGAFPGPWEVSGYAGYWWGKRSCRPYQGSYSGRAVGGGPNGAAIACGSNYPNDAGSWMIYGPFSLVSATAADLQFKLWLDTESCCDGVYRGVSVDGSNFYGYSIRGYSAGWIDRTLDLSSAPTLGNLMGQPQVWIVLYFSSNYSITYPEGAYVDNIILRKYVSADGSPPPALGSPESVPADAQITDIPRMMILEP